MKITSPEELGAAVRATRVALNLPLADLAEMLGTSQTLLRRQEQGKATTALRILFATLRELGVEVHVSLPPQARDLTIDPNDKSLNRKRARP